MTSATHLRSMVLGLCLALCFYVAGCGGGSSATVPPQQGNGQLPGTVGNIGNPPAAGDFPVAEALTGTSNGGAPLGTDPRYNVELLEPEMTFSPDHGASLVAGQIEPLELVKVIMVANNATPNWALTTGTFAEGAQVDIWGQYKINIPGSYSRFWESPQIHLNFLEDAIAHGATGTYTMKIDYVVPYGTAGNNFPLNLTVSDASYSMRSPNFTYNITAVSGGTTRQLYPPNPTNTNDSQGGGCKPLAITANFSGNSVSVTSDLALTNVVLRFTDGDTQKFEPLTGKTGTFAGTAVYVNEEVFADSVLASNNMNNASISRIDEDPSVSDGSWATATGNTVATDVRVSFATPGVSLDNTAGAQKFRALVRKFNSNSGTPTARLDVYQNGVLKVTGTAVNITSTSGQIIEQTWSSANIAAGSVECKIVCTVGGSGSTRNAVDVGAVRWTAKCISANNTGKSLEGAWVKSGCNATGDGPDYGEYFSNNLGEDFRVGFSQIGWEDLLVNADYDYNDFVGRMNCIEFKNSAGKLVQIQFTIKAIARAAGYDADWQFNITGAFPGATATAIVDQYYTNGQRHGPQKIWRSTSGASVPVFTPIRLALPNPPGSNITNGVPGTDYIDGDYAEVTVIFDTPVNAGTYTPMPYEPELRVAAGGGNVYVVHMWKKKGDWLDSNGRPLALIVPDTYAWPLEGKPVWTVYDNYNDWITYLNTSNGTAPFPSWWNTAPVKDYFRRDLFN